ncbi:aldose epimerase [Leifsonia shinshuensis]|uniref:aldose epimerase family protein n=1 Tax=Leifsonia shinshuensis TaxID=150026 RepID=UPI0028559DBA|nr:aldose epimerase [Leifsonia shinshuensis]MDR6972918.1 aldose 1-epimerase [Leifsonia shinshuensis]
MSERSEPVRLGGEAGGDAQALVSPVGASLQQLRVDGVDLVCGSPSGPVGASGAVLVPWPNRVRGGRWILNGEPQRLDPTEPSSGNALHGLVAATTFSVVRHERDAVEFAAAVRHPRGYPFDLDVIVSYRLVPSGIASTISVVNRGPGAAPVAVGVHPYLRVGTAASDDLLLTVQAERTLLLGDDNLPRGELAVSGTSFDLRTPTPLVAAPAHAAYTRLHLVHGDVRLTLSDRGTGRAAEVWAEPRFRWAQIYVTDELPGLKAGEVAVALEPMTAPPDALNSGSDLEWLGVDARWDLRWGVALR